ncbi:MAG: tRNA (guanosine(37)-N1)-methyltransferase TrmD [Negativicutes bacterium]|jgi:tRNA (guanine37-N1)-methyltransferase|nr:tRNA (guanosine(37)-N1)-methyltransferase TrmD [Negativicutes bacterium]MBP8628970.1 tRNA (guanosine(37)-N1)-methyltransferase TrmD [Negativicutes bacterium]MBP9536908.1 tRNA (guanosine(37)-N1)-methyltransferase TrmD [Negativicutes bacterium]MBP9949177.1 tRNA (guanosine(37)-N1)-methyltransferase TrmD [Negativicutes bacterium]
MKINIITIFPDMFTAPFNHSIMKRAQEKKLLTIETVNPRDFAQDKHQMVDDYPFGGGAGMVLKPEPMFAAVESLKTSGKKRVLLMCPSGQPFTQEKAKELAQYDELIFLCGHYEGFDARITDNLVDEAISIGDYVLTGGEIPAMVVIDAVARMLNGVLGSGESAIGDSFYNGLLEYPQYTRPREFRGMSVPEILLSGDHAKIKKWRHNESLKKTFLNRPDLLEKTTLSADDKKYLATLKHRSE